MKTLEQLGFKKKEEIRYVDFGNDTDRLIFFKDGSTTCYFKSTPTQEIFDAIQLELKKPKLTEEVKQLIRLIPLELKWMACDSNGDIYLFEKKPYKGQYCWLSGYKSNFCGIEALEYLLSPYMSWNDTEPTNLDEWRALL